MDGENKVAGVGVKMEPTVANNVADDLAKQMADRERAAAEAAAAARTPEPTPTAEVAAAAEALATEPVEKPKVAVFDDKSAAVKNERNKKARKDAVRLIVILLVLILLAGIIFLVVKLINSNKYETTKERANNLYIATAQIVSDDEENSCRYMLDNYTNERIGVETYNAYADNCKENLEKLAEAVKAADGDAGIKDDDSLNTKWQAFKQTYNEYVPTLLGKIDAYKAGHEFFVTYNTLDLYGNGDDALGKIAELAEALKNAGDENLATFGESIVETATALSQSYQKVSNLESALHNKYGSLEKAQNDPEYQDYVNAQQEYAKASENYEALAEVIFKDSSAASANELNSTLYDQAGALKATANNR